MTSVTSVASLLTATAWQDRVMEKYNGVRMSYVYLGSSEEVRAFQLEREQAEREETQGKERRTKIEKIKGMSHLALATCPVVR